MPQKFPIGLASGEQAGQSITVTLCRSNHSFVQRTHVDSLVILLESKIVPVVFVEKLQELDAQHVLAIRGIHMRGYEGEFKNIP